MPPSGGPAQTDPHIQGSTPSEAVVDSTVRKKPICHMGKVGAAVMHRSLGAKLCSAHLGRKNKMKLTASVWFSIIKRSVLLLLLHHGTDCHSINCVHHKYRQQSGDGHCHESDNANRVCNITLKQRA